MAETTQDTSTTSMTAIFTPAPSCAQHWTYEPQEANSITGGILLQDALFNRQDKRCRPPGYNAWGRAPSFIQVFSPGYCPIGYTTAVNGYNAATTTAVCCLSNFAYTTTVSTVNGGNKTAAYYGCTSIFPSGSGITTVFAETGGDLGTLDGTTTRTTAVTGPALMWAQPITVAFQQRDLSLFISTSSAPLSTALVSSATSARSPTSEGRTTSSSIVVRASSGLLSSAVSDSSAAAVSPTTSTIAGTAAPGIPVGAIAGAAIGAAAVLGLLIGLALFFRRRRHQPIKTYAPAPPAYQSSPSPAYWQPESYAVHNTDRSPAEMDNALKSPVEIGMATPRPSRPTVRQPDRSRPALPPYPVEIHEMF